MSDACFTIEDRTGIVDLMLSRRFTRGPSQVEHLVLELKRPTVRLGSDEITQIKNYAYTVCEDERFDKTRTVWRFVLLGNEMGKFGSKDAESEGSPHG